MVTKEYLFNSEENFLFFLSFKYNLLNLYINTKSNNIYNRFMKYILNLKCGAVKHFVVFNSQEIRFIY